MGAPMARNLAEAGIDVRAWNRTIDKARAVERAQACETPDEAARGADFVLTMLADGDAVENVARDLDFGDAAWLQMSTVGVDANERLMEVAGDVPFVDAPVVGTKQPAEKGELTVLSSGPREVRERAKPVFDAVGARGIELGDGGERTRLRCAVHAWRVTTVEPLAEPVALSEALATDPERDL